MSSVKTQQIVDATLLCLFSLISKKESGLNFASTRFFFVLAHQNSCCFSVSRITLSWRSKNEIRTLSSLKWIGHDVFMVSMSMHWTNKLKRKQQQNRKLTTKRLNMSQIPFLFKIILSRPTIYLIVTNEHFEVYFMIWYTIQDQITPIVCLELLPSRYLTVFLMISFCVTALLLSILSLEKMFDWNLWYIQKYWLFHWCSVKIPRRPSSVLSYLTAKWNVVLRHS